jgi:hypothetical protein
MKKRRDFENSIDSKDLVVPLLLLRKVSIKYIPLYPPAEGDLTHHV